MPPSLGPASQHQVGCFVLVLELPQVTAPVPSSVPDPHKGKIGALALIDDLEVRVAGG